MSIRPRLALLIFAALFAITCGRTELDQPVEVDAGTTGAAGSMGTAGRGGDGGGGGTIAGGRKSVV